MALTKRFLIVILAIAVFLVGWPVKADASENVSFYNPHITGNNVSELINRGMNANGACGSADYYLGHSGAEGYFEIDIVTAETYHVASMQVEVQLGGGRCRESFPGPYQIGSGIMTVVWILSQGGQGAEGNFNSSVELIGGVGVVGITGPMLASLNEWHGAHLKVYCYPNGWSIFHNIDHTWECHNHAVYFNMINFRVDGVIIPLEEQYEWLSLTTSDTTTEFTEGNIGDYGISGIAVTASVDGIGAVAWANFYCAPVTFRALYYPKSDPMPGLNTYQTTAWTLFDLWFYSSSPSIMLGKRGWWLLWFRNVSGMNTSMVWLKMYDPSLPGDDPDSYDPTPEPGEESWWEALLRFFRDFWENLLAFIADLFGPADQEHMNMLEEVGEDVQTRFPFSIVAWGAGVAGTLSVTGTSAPNLDFTIPAFFGVEETILHVPFDDWAPFWSTVRGIFTAGIWLGFAFLAIQFIRKLWL